MPPDPPRLRPFDADRRAVYALILAAGQSRRMGRPKQLLPVGDGTLLDRVIDAVLESNVDGLVLVVNPAIAAAYKGALPERCAIALNSDPGSEMLASTQIGLREVIRVFEPVDSDGVLVLLGDQPQVTGGTITTCAEAFRLPRQPAGILIATYNGRRGHPTVFSVGIMREILDWPGGRRLNELARSNPARTRELPIRGVPPPLDVNTPEDYLRLRGGDDPQRG